MNNNYARACSEVSEILQCIPQEYVNKIPLSIIMKLQENKEQNYKFSYIMNKTYEEQKLLEETRAILANLYIYYWATEEEKEEIKKVHNQDRMKNELLKRQRYNPSDLFKNKKIQNQYTVENIQLIELSKENFIKKIINKIKRFFSF